MATNSVTTTAQTSQSAPSQKEHKSRRPNRRQLLLFVFIAGLGASIPLGSLVFLILMVGFIVMICMANTYFAKTNKRLLVLFSFEGGEMRERFLGRIIDDNSSLARSLNTSMGRSAPFKVRQNFFSNVTEIHFTKDVVDSWKLVLPYRDRRGNANDVIFGSLSSYKGDSSRNKFTFTALCTAEKFKELISATDVLTHITSTMKNETEDRIGRFDTQTKSLMELSDQIEGIKTKLTFLMRRLNSTTIDLMTLIQEVFGLHPDEVNKVVVQQLVEKAKRRDEIIELVKNGKIDGKQLASLDDIELNVKPAET